MKDLKEQILHDLKKKTDPTAKRYGVTDAEFRHALDALVNDGKIFYTVVEDEDSPFYGIPQSIRLLMKNH